MPSEPQTSFFSRITVALGRNIVPASVVHRENPYELPTNLEAARVVPADGDLVELFATRVQQSGMFPHRVKGEQAAVAEVLAVVGQLAAKTAVVPPAPMPAKEALTAALGQAGVQLLDPDERDAAFVADVGITGVRLAVAETASMSVVSGDGNRRLASLAVPAHIALVRADQIVADLLDWGASALVPPPANEVLISAMSKTADIEGILVPGVHGPGIVHVIIIE